jgi:hypothetical protein
VAVASLVTAVCTVPAAAAPLTFHPPQYIDNSFAGGEPVLQVDTVHHTLVYSSHEGTTHIYRPGLPSAQTLSFFSEYRNQTKMWVSRDNGVSWRRIDFLGTGFATDPSKNTGFSDPDFSQDEGGRIYNTGINLINDAVFSSEDGGATWDRGTPECHPGDRPWLAGGRPDEVFMATNTLVEDPSHQIFVSTDGGSTCAQTGIPSAEGNGKLYYDHVGQRLIEPAQEGSGDKVKFGINVWKRGDAKFTFKPGIENTSIYAHWPVIAQDGAGTVYAIWDTDPRAAGTTGGCTGDPTPLPNEIRMIYTKDFGDHWSSPVTIARPDGHRVFWPWVAAGDKGKLSIVWYETDKVVDLACQPAAISIKAASVIGADTDQRAVDVADAAGRPVSVNNICQNGTLCVATGEDRRLGDFFTNAIDERGCAVIGSGDTMSKDPLTGGERNVALPIFIRQASGPRLIGEGDCSATGTGTSGAAGAGGALPSRQAASRACRSHRKFVIHLRAPKGQRLRSARVYVNGKRTRVFRRHGGRLHAVVDLRRLAKSRYTVKVVAVTAQGRMVTSTRRYRTCTPKRRS